MHNVWHRYQRWLLTLCCFFILESALAATAPAATAPAAAATAPAAIKEAVTAGETAGESSGTPSVQTALVLRPGDTVLLSLPGESSLNMTTQVQRNGHILLPEVGEVKIVGLTLSQATEKIKTQLQEVIHDLTAFELVLNQRRLVISVLGFVASPGTVDLTDTATIQEAITAAGGLIAGAQLDKLQVRRGDQVYPFNYKYYLDSGDPSSLPTLQPLDTIFVPSSPLIGNVQVDFDAATLTASGDAGDSREAVRVFGEVSNPGTFSYKKGTTIVDLIMRAGGVTRFSDVEKIRVLSNGAPVLFNLKKYLDTGDKKTMVNVSPGDTIFVPNEVDEVNSGLKAVHVIGEVLKPGRYDWFEQMSLFDLVTYAGGPSNRANITLVKVLSRDAQGNTSSRLFDMAAFIEKGGKLNDIPLLKAQDTVIVPALTTDTTDVKSRWIQQPAESSIYVMGEISAPGRYMFKQGMHFLDILTAGGGPTANADLQNIRITHRNTEPTRVSHIDLGYYFERGDDSLLPKVLPEDVIYLPGKDRLWLNERKEQTVRVLGAVNNQGRYRYNQSMTILDLLAQAGGLAPAAELSSIVVVSANAPCCDGKVNTFDLLSFADSGDPGLLPSVRVGDTVYVLNKEDSAWNRFLTGLQETISVYSLLKILGGG